MLLIGNGNMGRAMVGPLAELFDVTVVCPNDYRPTYKAQYYENMNLIKDTTFDYIQFAVKPYQLQGVLQNFNHTVYDKNTTFVSIIVAVGAEVFKKYLGENARIARVMPNLGVHVNAGVCVVLSDEKLDFLETYAKTVYVKTVHDFDRVGTICGCGTGYVYHIMQHYQQAALSLGIESEVPLKELVFQIFMGTMKHFEQNQASTFEELKNKVTTQKGTTRAGVDQMEDIHEKFEQVFKGSVARGLEIAADIKKTL